MRSGKTGVLGEKQEVSREGLRPKTGESTCHPGQNRTPAIGVRFHSLTSPSFSSFFFLQIKHCDDLGIAANKSSTLFSFIGVFAAVGRLGAGCLCDIKRINSLFLYQSAVFVSGASTILFLQAKTYASLAAVVVVFSVADGLMVSTFIIELFRSVQLSQRAPCLGFCMMVSGIFVMCSPPLSGESVYFVIVTLWDGESCYASIFRRCESFSGHVVRAKEMFVSDMSPK